MFGMTVSELQSFQLWDICWPSTIKPRWLTPNHHLASFEVLIWMDHAGLHIESFSTPSPWSFGSAFPLPPYKNLCLHWGVKMVFEAWNCHLLRLLAPQIKPLSFSPAPTYLSHKFDCHGGRQSNPWGHFSRFQFCLWTSCQVPYFIFCKSYYSDSCCGTLLCSLPIGPFFNSPDYRNWLCP